MYSYKVSIQFLVKAHTLDERLLIYCNYQFYLEHFSIPYHFTVLCSNAEQLIVYFPETVIEIAALNVCSYLDFRYTRSTSVSGKGDLQEITMP